MDSYPPKKNTTKDLTLEFLCILEVNTYKVSDGPTEEAKKQKTTGTTSFWSHNLNFEIPIETLEDMFHIPTDREGDFPKSFNSNELWAHIPDGYPFEPPKMKFTTKVWYGYVVSVLYLVGSLNIVVKFYMSMTVEYVIGSVKCAIQ
ncbi:hypothetical protein KIW84_066102 [Lathyrus oleraceus]|uniref:Arabidopsis retrotransposon Orf1 C-terminal domain-containing protein n=1 Tax=Pisum sativum TaxID=3888 RepID=A0A9D4WIM9_PEA|nr:hypothetical protein KIW84_066102 [Pisum sativum]